jgi:hypothetical protein
VTYVVGSDSLEFRGTRVADAGNGISLWRVDPPFRLAQWVQNVRFDGTVERHAKVFVYACRGGRLEVRLRADAPTRVELLRHERRYLGRELATGETLAASIPARPTRADGRGLCSFDVFTDATVRVDELRFVAPLL